jgi:hypothetical protein
MIALSAAAVVLVAGGLDVDIVALADVDGVVVDAGHGHGDVAVVVIEVDIVADTVRTWAMDSTALVVGRKFLAPTSQRSRRPARCPSLGLASGSLETIGRVDDVQIQSRLRPLKTPP